MSNPFEHLFQEEPSEEVRRKRAIGSLSDIHVASKMALQQWELLHLHYRDELTDEAFNTSQCRGLAAMAVSVEHMMEAIDILRWEYEDIPIDYLHTINEMVDLLEATEHHGHDHTPQGHGFRATAHLFNRILNSPPPSEQT